MPIDRNDYYSYPRYYFSDSVGRPYSEQQWEDFIQAMDKYALEYMYALEDSLRESD